VYGAWRDGYTEWFGTEIKSYRHPQGWQGILRYADKGDAYAVFHVFDGSPGYECSIGLPEDSNYKVDEIYSDRMEEVTLAGNRLSYKPRENWKAVAVYLKKQ